MVGGKAKSEDVDKKDWQDFGGEGLARVQASLNEQELERLLTCKREGKLLKRDRDSFGVGGGEATKLGKGGAVRGK